ncbi:unnamed protein product [Miscanthus lutarioriparius]|uniref:Prokaryotic-type class I peptide chain release factors domain-containing protein n=1 Tax=Miscanthus lutarioriparius TaxID=422564 RepID=A0A811S0T8_9POAL|nr:unnamed protein product [Miscanthus lutarioriparius]
MQHHLRQCGGGALAALRRLCHNASSAAASPPAAWRRPCPPLRLYSTAEMSQQLPANLVGIMEQRMKLIEQRSAYLQEQINQPAASPEEYSRANKEFHKLESTMELIKELRSKQEEIEGLKSLVTNAREQKDMREMAADERDCILEVRAGTGGEEASLFAMDIFRMYEKYAQKNGWKFDVIDIMESAVKGYKVDVQLRNEDLIIDTYRSGGSGGQSVNTTDSAVRITHIPTGTVVAIQDERSQHMNKAKALKALRARLYELERHRLHMDRSKLRSEQIGSGDRSERIRTYNFPQGRVTDHRVGITHHSIADVMEGESLDVFVDALLLQEEMDAIASFGA